MSNGNSRLAAVLGVIIFGILGIIFALSYIIDPFGRWSFTALIVVLVSGWLWTKKQKTPS